MPNEANGICRKLTEDNGFWLECRGIGSKNEANFHKTGGGLALGGPPVGQGGGV
jgi:hypothetical protein